ncbi:hypothetical protein VC83_00494 [Pseudogymnoascus destructans]|uniref:Mitochondrial import inner membrane translocase subunit TIM50 n=2 Tax=Pseudogymnoascus destructans TaxID=655981 RepID=L8GB11_PSED2|nr:uncharacterized protein VC83_00494 [Pseudogymnoascus destructans]ELR10405.1 hypothetical protein GMDG_00817 [Pseudogymnoascus destructans 20631-21]OAF63230.2 hypothetical protein VC83_00494 [Pseudogymnoascus destructans]
MNTKALIYRAASTPVWNCIEASSKITLTSAHRRHSRYTKMIPVGMRKQAHKALPTFQEMASQRIAVLDAAIAALNSREDANSKKLKKLAQHLAEKADLEKQLSQPPSSEATRGSLIIGDATSIDSTMATPGSIPGVKKQKLKKEKNQEGPSSQPVNQGEGQLPQPIPEVQITTRGLRSRKVTATTTTTVKTTARREPIVPPSAGSGGVPDPSPAYLERSLLAPQQAHEPQHILLVLDLNGTILYRPDRRRPSHFLERQSTDSFLNYILSRFQVMVWSSARLENVRLMADKLFPRRQYLVTEWGRDRMGLTPEDFVRRVQVYKRLEKVWAEPGIQSRHPLQATGATWDQSNTILIDDSLEKARSEPFNLVELPEFKGDSEPTDVLQDLTMYLDDILMQKDVSAYMRQNPFKAASYAASYAASCGASDGATSEGE